jgi:ketosteroid isomerase-like protein
MRHACTAILFAIACSSGRPGPVRPAPIAGELSPALAPLAWWLGDWESRDGLGSEHWVAAAGAIYGVALHPGGGFEVMIVDDGESPGPADGVLRLIAMPGGERTIEFRQRLIKDGSATFANDAHDYPKAITYLREGAELRALLGGGDRSDRFQFSRGTARPAPELEAADLAFARATAERGIAGWVAAFAPDGSMMRRGEQVAGAAAITELMGPTLASGKLTWAPLASGVAGTTGFTIGKATFTGKTPADNWRSSYVTIWQRQPDGAWKVRFDTGRVVHE